MTWKLEAFNVHTKTLSTLRMGKENVHVNVNILKNPIICQHWTLI